MKLIKVLAKILTGFFLIGLVSFLLAKYWEPGRPERKAKEVRAEQVRITQAEEVRKNTPPTSETLEVGSSKSPTILKHRGRLIALTVQSCVRAYWVKGPIARPLRYDGCPEIWANNRDLLTLDVENYTKADEIYFFLPEQSAWEKIWKKKEVPVQILVEYEN